MRMRHFLGPKWPSYPNENFFRKPVNKPCSFHSSLSTSKFLGRIIDVSLSDRNSSVELAHRLLAGLRIKDKSHFNDAQKLCI